MTKRKLSLNINDLPFPIMEKIFQMIIGTLVQGSKLAVVSSKWCKLLSSCKLISKEFPIEKFKGNFIKITAYGLKYLPPGEYKIIYTERNIEETLDSIEKMIGKKEINRDETKENIVKLNNLIKNEIQTRSDIQVLFVNYNSILENPKENIIKILNFLNLQEENLQKMIDTIDLRIYHNRRKNEKEQ